LEAIESKEKQIKNEIAKIDEEDAKHPKS